MLNLILHCGAQHVDRDEIDYCLTPTRTNTWVPIPHQNLLTRVENNLLGSGFRIINQAHALSGDAMRYFGLIEVANGWAHDDYNLVVGLRNSHDKSFPAALVLGSGVFVCDNLSFSGEVRLARRHTRFIERDLDQVVSRAVGQLGDMRQSLDHRIDMYKRTVIADQQAHDLMIRALDARVVPATKVPTVVKEWREPSYDEFARDGRTAWRFFNAVTEAIKGNLNDLPKRTQALHGLMDAACDFAVSSQ